MAVQPIPGAIPQPLRRDPNAPPKSENLTPWTPAQVEAAERSKKLHDAWSLPPGAPLYVSPAQEAEQRAEREARAEAERKARWPDPRAALRDGHRALAEAQEGLARSQEIAKRAESHLGEAKAVHAEAVRGEARARASAAARLKAKLGGNAAGAEDEHPAPSPEAVAHAERELGIAQETHKGLVADIATATRAVDACKAKVREAATALVVDHAVGLASQIEEAQLQLAEMRARLAGVDRMWVNGGPVKLPQSIVRALPGVSGSAGQWDNLLKRLVADPEAELG